MKLKAKMDMAITYTKIILDPLPFSMTGQIFVSRFLIKKLSALFFIKICHQLITLMENHISYL